MSSLKCIQSLSCFYVYFLLDGNHLDLHVLTHSVPTRRTSDLAGSAASTSGTAGSGPSLLTSPPRRQSRCHARAGTAPASASPRPSRRRSGGYARGDAASPRRGAGRRRGGSHRARRSEEHTSELQSLMRISYAVFCLKKKNTQLKLTLLIQYM